MTSTNKNDGPKSANIYPYTFTTMLLIVGLFGPYTMICKFCVSKNHSNKTYGIIIAAHLKPEKKLDEQN